MNPGALHARLTKLQNYALIIGIVASGAGVAGAFFKPRQFFIAYLVGWLFWLGLTLGCVGFLMVHHLTGGKWGFPVRRFYEAAGMTLPLMALLFIPICFGLHDLYLWMDPQAVAADQAMRHRSGYMNPPGFIIRAAVFFAFWIVVVLGC